VRLVPVVMTNVTMSSVRPTQCGTRISNNANAQPRSNMMRPHTTAAGLIVSYVAIQIRVIGVKKTTLELFILIFVMLDALMAHIIPYYTNVTVMKDGQGMHVILDVMVRVVLVTSKTP